MGDGEKRRASLSKITKRMSWTLPKRSLVAGIWATRSPVSFARSRSAAAGLERRDHGQLADPAPALAHAANAVHKDGGGTVTSDMAASSFWCRARMLVSSAFGQDQVGRKMSYPHGVVQISAR